jgi:hypothetical protein
MTDRPSIESIAEEVRTYVAAVRTAHAHNIAVERIAAILHGRASPQQGAILAELIAIWLIGHRPPVERKQAFKYFLRLLDDLMPLVEEKVEKRR